MKPVFHRDLYAEYSEKRTKNNNNKNRVPITTTTHSFNFILRRVLVNSVAFLKRHNKGGHIIGSIFILYVRHIVTQQL